MKSAVSEMIITKLVISVLMKSGFNTCKNRCL